MKKALVALAQALATVQRVVIELLRMIPGNKQVEEFAEAATRPIRNLAAFFLRKFPVLKRWEWLLEIDRLQRIQPVMLLLLLAFTFYRGTQTTYLGHIATDMVIYPYLGAISYFNPFLGILSAVAFGIGDILQKLLFNDIYGSLNTDQWAFGGAYADLNYWGGILGYCISYSSIVMAGLVPGMLARVFRLAARKMLAAMFLKRAAATADGAKAGNPGGQRGAGAGGASASASASMGSLMPGGTEPTYPVAELVASILGAGVGGAAVMYGVAPTLETPAFYLRPNPDVSCHDMEVSTYLRRPAFKQGLTGPGGGGPVISGLVPVKGPTDPDSPLTPDDFPDDEDGEDMYLDQLRDDWDPTDDWGPPDDWYPPDDTLDDWEPSDEDYDDWGLPDVPPLIDPRTGEELPVHDGNYDGGKPGDVWLDGKWVDPGNAAAFVVQWEKNNTRERQEWFDKETKRWQDDVTRKNREEGYDYDRYRDAWRKPPDPAEHVRIPEEDPDVLNLQKTKEDPGFWYRMFVGPSGAGYEKLNDRFNDLDKLQNEIQNRSKALAAGQKAAEESGDKWLAEHYKNRRKTERQNFFRVRDAKLDLAGRVTDSSKGGRKYRKYLKKNTTVTWEKAGRALDEQIVQPLKAIPKHIVNPHLADEHGDGPLGTVFKKLEKHSVRLQVRARQQPRLDAEFEESMDAVRLYGEQLRDAVRRDDKTAIRVLEKQLKAQRHRAVTINHFRGDLANKTRDWEMSSARLTAEYYKTLGDRTIAGQAQYHAGRTISRAGAKLTDLYSADAPVIRSRSIKGEAEAWDRLHKKHPEEFRKIRQKMAGDGGGGGGGGGDGLTPYERMLDKQWTQKQVVAGRKIARWNDNHVRLEQAEAKLTQARKSGTNQEVRDAMAAKLDAERRLGRSVNRGLSDPHVKMQMKKAPSDVQTHWGADAQKFRTDPVRRTTVDIINKEQPWVVETAPGQYRRLTPDDLESVSSHGKAGMDLDLNPRSKIVDTRTLQRVSDAKLQGAVNQACKKLRIDAGRQDIHVVSTRSPAAYRVPAGMEPKDVLDPDHVRNVSPQDAEHMKQVSEWKRIKEAGGDPQMKGYHGAKDHDRFTKPLMEAHPNARMPKPFKPEAMKVLDDLKNNRIGPGTAEARFRKITGMSVDEGVQKLNSLQEAVPVLDSPARRIEIARARGARVPRVDTPDAPTGTGGQSLKSLVGDTGPTLKTPGGKKLNDYLQRRDIRSFVDKDGKVHGFGRKSTPEVTGTREAAGIRAVERGAGPRGAVKPKRPFEELLDDARARDPVFKSAHDKVQSAISEGNSRRIQEVKDLHSGQMKKEGIWGKPDSPAFNKELGDRLKITPLDDPKTVHHQKRALFEGKVTEQEFDAYIDGRAKLRRGEPLKPLEPMEPLDPIKTREFIDVDRRVGGLGADPSQGIHASVPELPTPEPSAPQAPGPAAPAQPPPAPRRPPSPASGPSVGSGTGSATGPVPGSPVGPISEGSPSAPPDTMRPDISRPQPTRPDISRPEDLRIEATRPEMGRPDATRPDLTRPDDARPDISRPEDSRPDLSRPEGARPDVSRPEGTRPEFEIPEGALPEWIRPEPPKSRFASRFNDFLSDSPGSGK